MDEVKMQIHLDADEGSGQKTLCGTDENPIHRGGTGVATCIKCLRIAATFGYNLRDRLLSDGANVNFPKIRKAWADAGAWKDFH